MMDAAVLTDVKRGKMISEQPDLANEFIQLIDEQGVMMRYNEVSYFQQFLKEFIDGEQRGILLKKGYFVHFFFELANDFVHPEIGIACCGERGCQTVRVWVVAV